MLVMSDVIKKGNEILNQISMKVKIPLSEKNRELGIELLKFVMNSQIEENAKALGLRPAVGLAAPQIGVNKRMFAISVDDFDDTLYRFIVINPVIKKKSKEMIYLDNGEGCLSVDEEVNAATLRYKSIDVETYIYDFEKKKAIKVLMKLKDYPAIVFQHEFDHLDGILFTDKLTDFEEAKTLATPLSEIVGNY